MVICKFFNVLSGFGYPVILFSWVGKHSFSILGKNCVWCYFSFRYLKLFIYEDIWAHFPCGKIVNSIFCFFKRYQTMKFSPFIFCPFWQYVFQGNYSSNFSNLLISCSSYPWIIFVMSVLQEEYSIFLSY